MKRVIIIALLGICAVRAFAQSGQSVLGWRAIGMGGVSELDDSYWAAANQPAALAERISGWKMAALHHRPIWGLDIDQHALGLSFCGETDGFGLALAHQRAAGLHHWNLHMGYGRKLSPSWKVGAQWNLHEWRAPSEAWQARYGSLGLFGIYSVQEDLKLSLGARFPHRMSQEKTDAIPLVHRWECSLHWRSSESGYFVVGHRSGHAHDLPWQIAYRIAWGEDLQLRFGCAGLPLQWSSAVSFRWKSMHLVFAALYSPQRLPGTGMEWNYAF